MINSENCKASIPLCEKKTENGIPAKYTNNWYLVHEHDGETNLEHLMEIIYWYISHAAIDGFIYCVNVLTLRIYAGFLHAGILKEYACKNIVRLRNSWFRYYSPWTRMLRLLLLDWLLGKNEYVPVPTSLPLKPLRN